MNLPTEQECLNYFEEYCVPRNIFEHCQSVRNLAVFLANKLKESGVEVNMEFVNCLALLHDLFKGATLKEFKPNKFHNYIFSEKEIEKCKELNQKFSGLYEGEIFYRIFYEKFPELAISTKNYCSPKNKNKSWEELLVYYADLRTFRNKIVSLHERIDYLSERYLEKHKANPEYLEQKKKEVQEIEDKVALMIDINLKDLTNEMVGIMNL